MLKITVLLSSCVFAGHSEILVLQLRLSLGLRTKVCVLSQSLKAKKWVPAEVKYAVMDSNLWTCWSETWFLLLMLDSFSFEPFHLGPCIVDETTPIYDGSVWCLSVFLRSCCVPSSNNSSKKLKLTRKVHFMLEFMKYFAKITYFH